MIPDLGKYAVEVSAAYMGSILAIAILVALSLRRARKVRAALREIEHRQKPNG